MKIIKSITGGGKTIKVAELAAGYSNRGKRVKILTQEHTTGYYKRLLLKEDADFELISFRYVDSVFDVLSYIENDKDADVMFIDSIVYDGLQGKTYEEKVLKGINLMGRLEKVTGKRLYVTKQENIDSANNGKLAVIDYNEPRSLVEK